MEQTSVSSSVICEGKGITSSSIEMVTSFLASAAAKNRATTNVSTRGPSTWRTLLKLVAAPIAALM
eukprot:3336968-Pleurochrysis_carterae.AAC.7